jgi:hypothetical protein
VAEAGTNRQNHSRLTYIDDETKRRRTLTQLNRGKSGTSLRERSSMVSRESCGSATAKVQEDQLGALGLVVNTIVLWNMLYINGALQHLEADGYPIESQNIGRLSRLVSTTLICSAGMPSQCRKRSPAGSCGHCGVRMMPLRMSRERQLCLSSSVLSGKYVA